MNVLTRKNKILLCLLSDQLVPNLLSVHHYNPDKLVLIVTPQMKRNSVVSKMLEALRLGGRGEFKANGAELVKEMEILNEDSVSEAQKVLKAAHAAYPGASWIVNLVGGTKPMSIGAYDFFKDKESAKLIYTNVFKPSEIRDINDDNSVETCAHRLSVIEFLACYGIEAETPERKLKAKTERALKFWDCSRTIAEHDPQFLCITDRQRHKTARRKGIELCPDDFRSLDETVRRALIDTFKLTQKGDSIEGHIDKYAADFLTGGWLEVFFFGLLRNKKDALSISNIHLGFNCKREGAPNELDVVFMRNKALHIIECKSGTQKHDDKFDILYKVEAIKLNMKALRSKSYVATTAENIFKNGEIKEAIRKRSEIYGCRIITLKDIQMLAKNHSDAGLIGKHFSF